MSHSAVIQKESSSKFKIGTDCSGIETPSMALRQMTTPTLEPIPFEQVFWCENDPQVVRTIEANYPPVPYRYQDITQRDNSDPQVPSVDVYVAGFPCQHFSDAGKQQGFSDEKGRGTIFFYVLDYITQKFPKLFILENVKGLTTLEKGKYHKQIMKALHNVTFANALK